MDSPLISIVVTIYNKKKFLNKCLDSIICQTYKNLEIILIDDGSNDGSERICDYLAQNDRRIKIVHKSNEGVGSAKQNGLELLSGEYFIFVDADDWIEPDMIECLYNKIILDNSDVVLCDYYLRIKYQLEKYCSLNLINNNRNEILHKTLLQEITCSCCNRLIRSLCLDHYNTFFPKELKSGEDLYFSIQLFSQEINVSYISKAFYHYNLATNGLSLSKNINKDFIENRFRLLGLLVQKRYTDDPSELTQIKEETLCQMFMIRMFDELNKTYPEVHDSFKEKYKKFALECRLQYFTARAIEGRPLIAYIKYKICCYYAVLRSALVS